MGKKQFFRSFCNGGPPFFGHLVAPPPLGQSSGDDLLVYPPPWSPDGGSFPLTVKGSFFLTETPTLQFFPPWSTGFYFDGWFFRQISSTFKQIFLPSLSGDGLWVSSFCGPTPENGGGKTVSCGFFPGNRTVPTFVQSLDKGFGPQNVFWGFFFFFCGFSDPDSGKSALLTGAFPEEIFAPMPRFSRKNQVFA